MKRQQSKGKPWVTALRDPFPFPHLFLFLFTPLGYFFLLMLKQNKRKPSPCFLFDSWKWPPFPCLLFFLPTAKRTNPFINLLPLLYSLLAIILNGLFNMVEGMLAYRELDNRLAPPFLRALAIFLCKKAKACWYVRWCLSWLDCSHDELEDTKFTACRVATVMKTLNWQKWGSRQQEARLDRSARDFRE